MKCYSTYLFTLLLAPLLALSSPWAARSIASTHGNPAFHKGTSAACQAVSVVSDRVPDSDTVITWRNVKIADSVGAVTAVAVDVDGAVFVGTYAGVFRSMDQGNTWTHIDSGMNGDVVVTFALASGGRIVAGTNHGVYISTDRGASWREAVEPLKKRFIIKLAFDNKGILHAAADEGLILRSADAGDNWDTVADWGRFSEIRDLQIGKDGRVYAILARLLLYSDDGSGAWGASGFVPQALAMSSLAIDSLGEIFVNSMWELTGNGGVFRSRNLGEDWTPAGLAGTAGLSLAFDLRGRLLAGSSTKGLHRSSNKGGAWVDLNFPSHYITGFAFGPNEQIYVMANDSLFRSVLNISGVDDPAGELSATRLLGVSPNPATGATAIRFHLSARRHSSIILYDARGAEVARILDETLPEGDHERWFDASALPAGVYHCRLTAGGATSSVTVVVAR